MTLEDLEKSLSETEQTNIDMVKGYVQAVWNEQKGDTIYDLFANDFVYHYEHLESRGVQEWIEDFYKPLISSFSDINMCIDDICAHNDLVTYRWSAKVAHTGEIFGVTPSGETVVISGISWMRIADGRFAELWSSWNMSYFLRKLTAVVKQLEGILPICSYCKKIRNDKGYYEQVEAYVTRFSDAIFSHTLCPECASEHYPEIFNEKRMT